MRRDPPLSLRSAVDARTLCGQDYCDENHILGSFWPYSHKSFESRVVKGFKECNPITQYQPHVSQLAEFYFRQIISKIGTQKFEWIVRILGSAETEPRNDKPMSLLAEKLCRHFNARDCTYLFFRTTTRPPMRTIDRLSGNEVLKSRIQYVCQDLFIKPGELEGGALLIDDIANTGASVRVYAFALKRFAAVESVVAVNLAVTRFANGRDGRGMLRLNTSELNALPNLCSVTIDERGVFHLDESCRELSKAVSVDMKFLADRRAKPCEKCVFHPSASLFL
jgi:predicted amidophosphoribosyltransferase